MDWIAHRGDWNQTREQNTLQAFERAFVRGWGVETDVRQTSGKLVLSHDPVTSPAEAPTLWADFARLRECFPNCPVFLNIKEDGLLPLLVGDLRRWSGTTVCFDMSVPELVRYARELPPHRLATRISEFEQAPLWESCDWVWCDGFRADPKLDGFETTHPKLWGKSLALVSPELHGRPMDGFHERAACLARRWPARIAVCTDTPSRERGAS